MLKLFVTLMMIISFHTSACLLHGMPTITSVKGAFEVNIATNMAMLDSHIKPVKLQKGDEGIHQVEWWLTLFQKHLKKSSNTFVYVADIGLWVKLGDFLEIEFEIEPNPGDSIIILHRQVLQSIVTNQMTIDETLALGLLIME